MIVFEQYSHLKELQPLLLELEKAITLILANMKNETLPVKRKRKIAFEISLNWVSADMVGIAGVFRPKGDIPLCTTVPFWLRAETDAAGKIRVRAVDQKDAVNPSIDTETSDLFAKSSGATGEIEDDADIEF